MEYTLIWGAKKQSFLSLGSLGSVTVGEAYHIARDHLDVPVGVQAVDTATGNVLNGSMAVTDGQEIEFVMILNSNPAAMPRATAEEWNAQAEEALEIFRQLHED